MVSMSNRSGFLRFLFRRTIELLAVTVSATIGTLPLLVYHFNHLSTVTLPANLIVEPLVCFWALPCGFVAIPLLYIYPPLAKTVLLFGTWSLDLATKYIFHLTTFPMSSLWLPDIGIAKISLFYVSLFFIILCHSSRTRSFAFTVLAITLFMIIAPVSGLTDKFRTSTSVSFIDVGQGSSSLLELAGGRTIIIDAGAATTPGFNCGKRIIAPYLWSLGIGRIDDIILTHADADHYNGISALLERFQPDRLWIPRHQSEKQGYNALLARAQSLGIQILHPKRETFISENLITLSRVDNRINDKSDETSFDQVKTDDNDNSLIISFKTGDFSVLFPGDITSSKEQKLVREEGDLRHDILLSPHHGSATSNSPEFLEAVNPQYLVVSAGDNARQLFPAMATRVSAEALGITVVTTGQAGTVRVAGNDGGYVITTTSR